MMQSIASDPQYMNQIMNLNPQLRGMFDLNPQLREMMQNPEVLRQMFSPETMQQMLALQLSLLSQLSAQDSAQSGATTGAPGTAGLELLMNMFGGLGAGSQVFPANLMLHQKNCMLHNYHNSKKRVSMIW